MTEKIASRKRGVFLFVIAGLGPAIPLRAARPCPTNRDHRVSQRRAASRGFAGGCGPV